MQVAVDENSNSKREYIKDVTVLDLNNCFEEKQKILTNSQVFEVEQSYGRDIYSFSWCFGSIALMKTLQLLLDGPLPESIVGSVFPLMFLSVWCGYLIAMKLKPRYLRYAEKLEGLLLYCFSYYLLVDTLFQQEFAKNSVLIVLTFMVILNRLEISRRVNQIHCFILFILQTSTWFYLYEVDYSWLFIAQVSLIITYFVPKKKNTSSIEPFMFERGPTANENIEQAIKTCDFISYAIEKASKELSYSRKKQLFKACHAIKNIKKQIARGPFVDYIPEDCMDEEERAFCIQHYTNNSSKSAISASRRSRRSFIESISNSFDDNILFSIGKIWNFDAFMVKNSRGNPMQTTAKFLVNEWKLDTELNLNFLTVKHYFEALENSYKPNPYHNETHATDVLCSILYFIRHSFLSKELNLMETFLVMIAALAHDVGHPGVNNKFLVNSKDKLAIRYNDISVLENMHSSIAFELMSHEHCNVLEFLSEPELAASRKMIVDMILSTDMSKHFESVNRFSARLRASDLKFSKDEDKVFILCIGLKCADLGHTAKNTEIHTAWTQLICEEFFAQGDLEKQHGINVSIGFDRNNTNIPKSQSGFLRHVCLPLFEKWAKFLNSSEIQQNCVDQLKENISHWEKCFRQRKMTFHIMSTPTFSGNNRQNSLKI